MCKYPEYIHKVCVDCRKIKVVKSDNVDVLPYNGIKNWRCLECFLMYKKSLKKIEKL